MTKLTHKFFTIKHFQIKSFTPIDGIYSKEKSSFTNTTPSFDYKFWDLNKGGDYDGAGERRGDG